MIDETKHAFGIDISRYDSANSLMDFKIAAKYTPYIRFIGIREGISWGYKDPFFDYHWEEAGKMHEYRMNDDQPVGRVAYHVIYPSQPVKAQTDNLFKNILQPDWEHNRIAIDAELDQSQPKSRITQVINEFGFICKQRTGRLPILYSRRNWILEYTNVVDLMDFDLWLAQYLWPRPYPLYTPEYEPPPTLIEGRDWLIHQGSSKGKGDDVGVFGKHYVDHNRWNGGAEAIADYFQLDGVQPPPMTLEERVADNTRRIEILEETQY